MNIGVLVLSEQQLVRWLPMKGFSSYILAFADQGITGQHLPVSAQHGYVGEQHQNTAEETTEAQAVVHDTFKAFNE